MKPWVKISAFFLVVTLIFASSVKAYQHFQNKEVKTNKEYQACLNVAYEDVEIPEEITNKIEELNTYLHNYRVSVKYQDLKTGFTYSYKADTAYYAASTIKVLDALYLYTKASSNEINLDDTITYTKDYREGESLELDKHEFGEEISLRDLIKYALVYSDNTAHRMLIKYIGFNELKNFGNSLGAVNTLIGGDNFGEISADDAIIYLKNIYDFIENNKELGQELQDNMTSALENMLKYEGLKEKVGHKYGEYEEYFHDIGIVYDKNPYLVAILTTHGHDDYSSIVGEISKKINELHQSFKNYRQEKCEELKV